MSPEPILTWKSCPFLERPYASILLLSFLFLVAVLLYGITIIQWGYPIFYYGGMLLLILNLLPYFIVTEYRLLDTGIEIVYMRVVKINRKYSDFGCFYQDKHGIMLSTFKMPRRLDSFRGQSLRFSKEKTERAQLIEILSDKVGKQY